MFSPGVRHPVEHVENLAELVLSEPLAVVLELEHAVPAASLERDADLGGDRRIEQGVLQEVAKGHLHPLDIDMALMPASTSALIRPPSEGRSACSPGSR